MTADRIQGRTIAPGSIKICGIRETEHAIAAALAGADLLGFNFAPSRRYVSPDAARWAIDAARAVAIRPILAVGVFVNAPAEEMNDVADAADLDIIQLSGDEPPDIVPALNRPVLRALRPPPGAKSADVLSGLNRIEAGSVVGYLLDGHSPGLYGGTGVKADWTLAAELADSVPVVLAGGLKPENVARSIEVVVPLGVDVSSGVERDGVKDEALIAAFVKAARAAFQRG